MSKKEGIDRVILPDDGVPVEYDLTLSVDLPRFQYEGKLEILYTIDVATNELHLHSRGLIGFLNVEFHILNGKKVVKCQEVNINLKKHIVTFRFEEILPVGENVGVLKIPSFTGVLNDSL